MPRHHAPDRDDTRWATAIHTSVKAQGTRETRWRRGVAAFLVWLCVHAVGGWASDKDAFLDYINNRQARGASPWAIFLGLGQTAGNIQEWVAHAKAEGAWVNPFTGERLDGVDVLAFGQDNLLLEAARVIGDHLELYLLSPRQELKGRHWDFLICHSNGCTRALGYLKSGAISARHVFAIGTDWTSMPFKPGDLRGASVTFFVNATDPVPVIPSFELRKVTEDTPGLGYSIAFEHLGELPERMLDRVTKGRADVDRFPVVHLDPPPGRTGLKAHGLTESYFPSIRAWMETRGALQDTISRWILDSEATRQGRHGDATLRNKGADTARSPARRNPEDDDDGHDRRDGKSSDAPWGDPGPCPGGRCFHADSGGGPWGGPPGPGGGSSGSGGGPSGPEGWLPKHSPDGSRGSILSDIPITEGDFATPKRGKR